MSLFEHNLPLSQKNTARLGGSRAVRVSRLKEEKLSAGRKITRPAYFLWRENTKALLICRKYPVWLGCHGAAGP
jgi:hypothetical protein